MPLRAFIDGQEVLAPLISDGDWEALKLQRHKQVCLSRRCSQRSPGLILAL
jgi:hypothetical protein